LSAIRPWVSHMWYTWRSEALRVEGREAVVSGIRVVRGCETRDRSCLGARVARRGRRGWSASRAPLRGAGDDGVVHEVVHARESRLFAVLRVRRGGRAGRAERRHRRAPRRRVRAARRERRVARALDRRSLRGSWRRRIQRQSCDEEGFEAWRYLPAPAARCCGSRIASRHRRVKTRVTPRSGWRRNHARARDVPGCAGPRGTSRAGLPGSRGWRLSSWQPRASARPPTRVDASWK
jgi:hypothetical protein